MATATARTKAIQKKNECEAEKKNNSIRNRLLSLLMLTVMSTLQTKYILSSITIGQVSNDSNYSCSSNDHNDTGTSDTKLFGHFLMHIPKSGTSYAFYALGRLLYSTPEWQNLLQLHQHFRACDQGTAKLKEFRCQFREQYKGTPCTMWMSEQPYSPTPEHVYGILRDPRSHTLSMYFHCLESRDHRKHAYRMPPSLDAWLDAWLEAKHNTTQQLELGKSFHCYNPLNFQTRWIGHNVHQNNYKKFNENIYYTEEKKDDINTAMITKNNNNTGNHPQQHYNKQYRYSEQDVKDRYTVLGDHSQMDKSVCMIFIHYTGWVPQRCDCSTTSTSSSASSLKGNNDNATANSNVQFAHGVTHHGSSYPTTPSQDNKIALICDLDYPLYETSRRIFQEQVQIVEDKHNITLCEKLSKK